MRKILPIVIPATILGAVVAFSAVPAPNPVANPTQDPVNRLTPYLGVQYGLPNYAGGPNGAFNEGGGCVTGYNACFTIPQGRSLREGRGSLTLKVDNIEVLLYVQCGPSGTDILLAMEALTKGTYMWSTPVQSQQDPYLLGPMTCQINWQADNNTNAPIPDGAAFEVQGVFSVW